MSAASKVFKMGAWNGLQIDELSLYNDGVIVAAPQKTHVVDGFIDDLYDYVQANLNYGVMTGQSEARHYESALVVELPQNVTSRLSALYELSEVLSDYQQAYGLPRYEFQPARLGLDVDAQKHVGKQPIPFLLERRQGEPFEANRWFSAAPLKSDDHVTAIAKLEKALVG